MKKGFVVFLVVVGLFGMSGLSFAAEENVQTLRQEIEALKVRLAQLEARVAEEEGEHASEKKKLADYEKKFEHVDTHILRHQEKPALGLGELNIGAGLTSVVQGTNKANGTSLSREGEDVTDATYSLDLELEKKLGEWGTGFVHLESGNGVGVEDDLQVFSNVNYDANDANSNLTVAEAYYEQKLFSDNGILTVGKLDPTVFVDNNDYANDETSQFLGRMFRNNPAVEFPGNGGGIRIGYVPVDNIELTALASDGDADFENIFNDVFAAGQAMLTQKFGKRQGHYRLLGWMNDTPHTRWLDAERSKERGYGFGMSIDQELTSNLGAFARYGWQNPKVYLNSSSDFSLERSWSSGVQLKGALWKRHEDVIGLAFGQMLPSRDYKKADSSRNAHAESHLELYYNYKLNEYFMLSSDVQMIIDPYGDDAIGGDDAITVFGTRGQLSF